MRDLSGALQECLEAVKEKRNLQEVLRRYPADREELIGMLRLSVDLQAMGAPLADPAFRLRTRNRMLALAAQRRRADHERFLQWLPRRVGRLALAGAAALVPIAAGFTVAAASNNSLPGDPLYGVKLGVERAEVAITFDSAARARLELQFAERRLNEAQRLYAMGRTTDAVALVNQYDVAVSRVDDSLAAGSFDAAAVEQLTGYLKDRQATADASLTTLAGSFKAHGDASTAAIVAQDQNHVDQAFNGSQHRLQARDTGTHGQDQGAQHQPKYVGSQR